MPSLVSYHEQLTTIAIATHSCDKSYKSAVVAFAVICSYIHSYKGAICSYKRAIYMYSKILGISYQYIKWLK